jgi:hypothetical protein
MWWNVIFKYYCLVLPCWADIEIHWNCKKENWIELSQKQILKNDSIENVEFESIFLTSAFSYLTLDREPNLERNQTQKTKQKRNKNKDKKQNTMKKRKKKNWIIIIIYIRPYEMY